jgi:hypothetical protein
MLIRQGRRTAIVTAAIVILAGAVPAAMASILLEWRPVVQTVNVGNPVGVGLYAVSDSSEDQFFDNVQVVIAWENEFLQLTGVDPTGSIGLATSAFTPGDPYGLNEAEPPADGNGIWFGIAASGQTLPATPAGSLLTTVMFQALIETPSALVDMLPDAQSGELPIAYTEVNLSTESVLGTLGTTSSITIVTPEPTSLALLGLAALAAFRRR